MAPDLGGRGARGASAVVSWPSRVGSAVVRPAPPLPRPPRRRRLRGAPASPPLCAGRLGASVCGAGRESPIFGRGDGAAGSGGRSSPRSPIVVDAVGPAGAGGDGWVGVTRPLVESDMKVPSSAHVENARAVHRVGCQAATRLVAADRLGAVMVWRWRGRQAIRAQSVEGRVDVCRRPEHTGDRRWRNVEESVGRATGPAPPRHIHPGKRIYGRSTRGAPQQRGGAGHPPVTRTVLCSRLSARAPATAPEAARRRSRRGSRRSCGRPAPRHWRRTRLRAPSRRPRSARPPPSDRRIRRTTRSAG